MLDQPGLVGVPCKCILLNLNLLKEFLFKWLQSLKVGRLEGWKVERLEGWKAGKLQG